MKQRDAGSCGRRDGGTARRGKNEARKTMWWDFTQKPGCKKFRVSGCWGDEGSVECDALPSCPALSSPGLGFGLTLSFTENRQTKVAVGGAV